MHVHLGTVTTPGPSLCFVMCVSLSSSEEEIFLGDARIIQTNRRIRTKRKARAVRYGMLMLLSCPWYCCCQVAEQPCRTAHVLWLSTFPVQSLFGCFVRVPLGVAVTRKLWGSVSAPIQFCYCLHGPHL